MDGLTLRQHLQSLYRQTGEMPAQLAEAPCLPDGLAYLWADFLELHQSRAPGFAAPTRISWADLDSYQRVRGVVFEGWEIEAIRRADSAFLTHMAEARRDH